MTTDHSATAEKPRRIVVCSDGTGAAGGRGKGSNVWRIRQAVARTPDDGSRQFVLYEDGVGTQSLAPLRILGGAFGYGMKQDLRSLYGQLIRKFQEHKDGKTYSRNNQLYLFGFSRGAFIIRTLANIIYTCGIADAYRTVGDKRVRRTPEEIDALVHEALDAYARRIRDPEAPKRFRLKFGIESDAPVAEQLHPDERKGRFPIKFIGVWDTVDAVSLPFDNFTQWLTARGCFGFRMNMRREETDYREWKDDDLHNWIENAYHAMCVDDERLTFHPVLWLEFDGDNKHKSESPTATGVERKIEQVWFPGVHSNVGGGYPKDHLALIPLEWMMRHASREGLQFNKDLWYEYQQEADEQGKLYDSRSGMGSFYRYRPRLIAKISKEVGIDGGDPLDKKPRIHASVLRRIRDSTHEYAPAGIPLEYVQVENPPLKASETDATKSTSGGEIESETTCPTCGEQKEQKEKQESDIDYRRFAQKSLLLDLSKESSDGWPYAEPPPRFAPEKFEAAADLLAGQERLKWVACNQPADESTQTPKQSTRKDVQELTENLVRVRRLMFYMLYAWTLSLIGCGLWLSSRGVSRGIWYESTGSDWFWLGLPFLSAVGVGMIAWAYSTTARPIKRRKNEYDDVEAKWHYLIARQIMGGAFLSAVLIAFRPLLLDVALWMMPALVEPILLGIGQSTLAVTAFGLTYYLLVRWRMAVQQTIRAANVSAWLKALNVRAEPYRESFLTNKTFHKYFSDFGNLSERFMAPVVALTILAVLLIGVTWMSLRGVMINSNVTVGTSLSKKYKQLQVLGGDTPSVEREFATGSTLATGVRLNEGRIYRIAVWVKTPWFDGGHAAGPDGLEVKESILMKGAKSQTRAPNVEYFQLLGSIARPDASPFVVNSGQAFCASDSGELFLFVNDVPGFYGNNKGTATVTVELVSDE